MSLTPGTRLGPYEILSPIGEGGMGEVYRARDTKLDRDVAIKVLPESFAQDADRLARFTREAKTLASLNHPNIAQIYGIENNALVMELVEGDDLSAIVARGALPLSDALPIAKQIADALEAAHELGIVHRDLKPANIKVRADGAVKVLDFGLAKATDPAGASNVSAMNSPTMTSPAMTGMGMILGTAAYMSPEQAKGRVVDKRADIWAFGVVFYEMLTGRRAFQGDDVSDLLVAVLSKDVDLDALPIGTPPSIISLIRRCLVRDPKQRLRDIGEARVEIAKIESGAPDSISGVLPATVTHVPGWRRALPWAVAAVAVIGAAITALIVAQRGGGELTPVWTSIPAPVTDFVRGSPVVSPDGQTVAFVANNAAGTPKIWLRRLDAQSAQEMAGTDKAGWPFWSPDGLWIGFFKGGKLQKIPASGGQPQILADAANPRGAAWSPRGTILFVPAPAVGIYRVPSAGGSVERLKTSADESTDLPTYPSFLPDGEHFLFSGFRDGEQWISLGSLDGTPTVGILRAFSRAEYSNGYLLFGSKGALYAQPFDVSTLRVSGDRVRLVDQLGFGSGGASNYAFSASPTTVVAGNQPFIPLSRLTWFDGQGKRLSDLGEARHINGFSVSPDRSKAALEIVDPVMGSNDPWIIQLTSGFAAPMRAGVEGARANSPIWSRDGQQVFYSDGQKMRVASLAGRAETAWPVGPHWPISTSPDGQYVLIDQQNELTGSDLMLVSLTGDHTPVPWLQTSFNEVSGRFSPDGHSVAYVSDETGHQEVYVESFPQRESKKRVSRNGGTQPEWSEDGKMLYFLAPEAGGKTGMMVDVIGSSEPPRRLFEVEAGQRDPGRSQYAVFDNGRRFLINVFVPVTAPGVITVGQNWTAALGKKR